MGGQLLVDARYLEPPEPFVRVMEALDVFDRDSTLDEVRLLIFREPFPLYKVLDEHRYVRQTTLQPDGTYEIVIRRPAAT